MSWLSQLSAPFLKQRNSGTDMLCPAQGGLALPRNKPGLGDIDAPINDVALPEQLIIPLLDYSRQAVECCVAVGSEIGVGTSLAKGVIATANGTVAAIESRPIIHPSYREALCVVLNVDLTDPQQTLAYPASNSLSLERLEQACVAGLGGAGFATAQKLRAALQNNTGIDTLLVNAVECEPMISCDEALIRSDATAVVSAIHALIRLSQCRRCIVAIEEDKTEAVLVLRNAIAQASASTSSLIDIIELPAIYPSGAEKVLIQRLTGKSTSSQIHASDLGVLCLNVATIVAAHRAQAGHPLVSRIITVGGGAASQPCNVRVRIGTPIAHVLHHTGNAEQIRTQRVRAGGPLSGFDLIDLEVPVTATTNCIGIEDVANKMPATSCIRCSQCSDVCPVNLLPQQLYWYATRDDLDGAKRFGLQNCIECGCCDVVCPSAIELTSTFRYARTASGEQHFQNEQAELARKRYEKHVTRDEQRKQEAALIREQKKAQLASSDDSIAATLARARARRKKT